MLNGKGYSCILRPASQLASFAYSTLDRTQTQLKFKLKPKLEKFRCPGAPHCPPTSLHFTIPHKIHALTRTHSLTLPP